MLLVTQPTDPACTVCLLTRTMPGVPPASPRMLGQEPEARVQVPARLGYPNSFLFSLTPYCTTGLPAGSRPEIKGDYPKDPSLCSVASL